MCRKNIPSVWGKLKLSISNAFELLCINRCSLRALISQSSRYQRLCWINSSKKLGKHLKPNSPYLLRCWRPSSSRAPWTIDTAAQVESTSPQIAERLAQEMSWVEVHDIAFHIRWGWLDEGRYPWQRRSCHSHSLRSFKTEELTSQRYSRSPFSDHFRLAMTC